MGWLQVHLIATGDAARLPPALGACLPLAERQRALALRRPQDRINRLVAHAALRLLAAAHAGLPTSAIAVQRDAHGKPQLLLPAGQAPLHANLSHSGALVGIALAGDPVGIDLEAVREVDWQPLRAAHFPHDPWPREGDHLRQFHALWTGKEALLKATGAGLRQPLAPIVLRPPARRFQPVRRCPAGSALARFEVALLDAPAGYVGAIATVDPPADFALRCVPLADFS